MVKTGANKAQNIGEYAFVLAAVAAGLVAMWPYLQRSAQGLIKLSINEIGVHDEEDFMFNAEDGSLLYSRAVDGEDSRSKIKTHIGGKTEFNVTMTTMALDTATGFFDSSMVDHGNYTSSLRRGEANRGLIPLSADDISAFNTNSSRIYVSFEGSSMKD